MGYVLQGVVVPWWPGAYTLYPFADQLRKLLQVVHKCNEEIMGHILLSLCTELCGLVEETTSCNNRNSEKE